MKRLAMITLGVLLSASSWAAGSGHSANVPISRAPMATTVSGMPLPQYSDSCPAHMVCKTKPEQKSADILIPAAKADQIN